MIYRKFIGKINQMNAAKNKINSIHRPFFLTHFPAPFSGNFGWGWEIEYGKTVDDSHRPVYD